MSKQINLVINGKGGVGKSFFATNLVQYLKDRRLAHRAIDTDHENSTLKRFHPEAEFVSLETSAGSTDLRRRGDEQPARHRLPRGFHGPLPRLLRRGRSVRSARRSRRAAHAVCPVNHEADSVEQVRLLSDALGGKCRYVIVKNQAHSDAFRSTKAARCAAQIVGRAAAPRDHDAAALRLARDGAESAQRHR